MKAIVTDGFVKVKELFGLLLVTWLLIGFYLPETIWTCLSASALGTFIVDTFIPLDSLSIIASLLVLIWLYGIPLRGSATSIITWVCLLLIGIGIYLTPRVVTSGGVDIMRDAWLLYLLAVGLTAGVAIRRIRQLFSLFVFFGLMQSIYGLLLFFLGRKMYISHDIARMSGTFEIPASFYSIICICLIVTVGLLDDINNPKLKGWGYVAISVFIACLTLAMSRACILSSIVGIICLLSTNKNNKRLKQGLIVLLGLILIVTFLVRNHSNVANSARDVQYRTTMWSEGIRQWIKSPWVGTGIDRFSFEIHEYTKGNIRSVKFVSPANLFIHWLAEGGIVGAIIMICLLACLLRVALQMKSSLSRTVLALTASLAIMGCFDAVFGRPERSVETVTLVAISGCVLRQSHLDKLSPSG